MKKSSYWISTDLDFGFVSDFEIRISSFRPRNWDCTMTKIAILGGTGYTAAELIKILLRHPHAEIVAVTSRDEKMPAVAESHPSLAGRIKLRMEPLDADK